MSDDGVFHKIVEPERLVFTSAALDERGNPLFEVLSTVTFAEHGSKTKLTVHTRVVKATAADGGIPRRHGRGLE